MRAVALALAAGLACAAPARAAGDPTAGAWHYHSIPCADGVVTEVAPRLVRANQTVYTPQDFASSGVVVVVRLPPGTTFLRGVVQTQIALNHYQDADGNAIMQASRRADRVQVCLLSFPTPEYSVSQRRVICDPDADPRGWSYRVYDYRLRAAYSGLNSEHGCGGA